MFYLFIFIVLILFSFLELHTISKKVNLNLQVIVVVIFVFIAGLRYETGVDWRAYTASFDALPALDVALSNNRMDEIFETLDVGYYLFNSFVKMFGGGIQVVFFYMSLLSTVLLIKNLRYYSNYVLTGLLIYYPFFFFVFDMSGIRQCLTIQIFFYAIRFIDQKRFWKFFSIIILATTVHWSTFLLFPFYFLINHTASKKFTISLFAVTIIIFTFQIKWLGSIMGDVLVQLNFATKIADKVDAYTTKEIYAFTRKWDLYTVFNFIRIAFVVFLSIRFKDILSERVKHFTLLYNLILTELFVFFCLYEFTEISERMRYYFLISEVILISNVIYCFKSTIFKHVYFLLFLVVLFLNSYPFLLNLKSTVAYHPYQNYWVYSILNLKSDGDDRLEEHRYTHE
jgi:transmembrane protein EpsG